MAFRIFSRAGGADRGERTQAVRGTLRSPSLCSVGLLALALGASHGASLHAQQTPTAGHSRHPLVRLLRRKGILTEQEAAQLDQQSTSDEDMTERLEKLLVSKGVITQQEYDAQRTEPAEAPGAGTTTSGTTVAQTPAKETTPAAATAQAPVQAQAQTQTPAQTAAAGDKHATPIVEAPPESVTVTAAESNQTLATQVQNPSYNRTEPPPHEIRSATSPELRSATGSVITSGSSLEHTRLTPEEPTVISAFTPFRLLPVGRVLHPELQPAFTTHGVEMTPYGYLRTTFIHDSSSPYGDDFPLPGFLSNTDPTGDPEVHVKARNSRFGANFLWHDPSEKVSVTGKIEFDFEGNFSRADNRNLSSIRSNAPSLRLAFGRIDYQPNPSNNFSVLFGQDWSPYGSSTIPSMLELTGIGIGFGNIWERIPQVRFGYTHNFGKKLLIMPEFAIAQPASGLTPSAAYLSQQLAYGEREGADSGRPNYEGRIVAQWQLDKAHGVAPAQIIGSWEHGARQANVLSSAVPTGYQTSFSRGATASSITNGWSGEWQLPTRWFTLFGKVYGGSDLRFFFAGQLFSNYSDTTGLTNLATATSVDGSSTVTFGTNALGQQVVAPQRPIRAMGGFTELGLPLSRLFGAEPGSRMAGWQVVFGYGTDQAKARDVTRAEPGGSRQRGDMILGTLNYQMNKWVTFSLEGTRYRTLANPHTPAPLFEGTQKRSWENIRYEAGPTFTF